MTAGVLVPAGAAAAVLGLLAATWVVRLRRRWLVVTVRGGSMLPTYAPGDRLLARRCRLDQLHIGDVVVFLWHRAALADAAGRLVDQEWVVKRVAALPGDPAPEVAAGATPAVTPPGTLVVLGDSGGEDSRWFGPLAAERLLAVVVRRLSPATRSERPRPIRPPTSRPRRCSGSSRRVSGEYGRIHGCPK